MPNLLSFPTSCVCLEPRPLPSTGITRLPRYYGPLRHPTAPGLSLTGVRLVILHHAKGLPVLRASPLCTCCRHYPGTAPIASGWSENCRVGLSPTGKRRLYTAHAKSSRSLDTDNPADAGLLIGHFRTYRYDQRRETMQQNLQFPSGICTTGNDNKRTPSFSTKSSRNRIL